jgi:hypothetical protein
MYTVAVRNKFAVSPEARPGITYYNIIIIRRRSQEKRKAPYRMYGEGSCDFVFDDSSDLAVADHDFGNP